MASTTPSLIHRQIWVDPTPTSASIPHSCTPVKLSSGGQINIGGGTIITLTQDAAFQPACMGAMVPPPVDPLQPGVDLSMFDAKDPWYSSTNPQIYAISAVTIVSYMLVVILFITPRTFFVSGAGGGGGFLGQAGALNGAYGSNSVIGVGSRPWLQKIAALTVAVSMTIVTADTFTWAHRQYDAGYEDATELTSEVIGGLEVRIVRVISETFLWLAQAQTLIRLFPRHKEKLLIKWLAFALIVLELIFSCLNRFLAKSGHSKKFVSAVPAMDYLFALTLNLCYGGFIVFYALQKRRFAFYHPHMRNMPLVALLSLTAIMIPVVFFILDLSSPNISGWGSYVRWVGSAAASVVVWEWVERIEALERDEKRGGILGREIFEGDEMLDITAGSDTSWAGSQSINGKSAKRGSGPGFDLRLGWTHVATTARRLGRLRHTHDPGLRSQLSSRNSQVQEQRASSRNGKNSTSNPVLRPRYSSAVASPLSRATTASAESPVYVLRHISANEASPSIQGHVNPHQQPPRQPDEDTNTRVGSCMDHEPTAPVPTSTRPWAFIEGLQHLPNPFRRQRETPPPEVARALAGGSQQPIPSQGRNGEPSSMLQRLRIKKTSKENGSSNPVIIVPAPPQRKRSWNEIMDEGRGIGSDTIEPIVPNQSSLEGDAIDRDADQPPDAVLNAIGTSRSVSAQSDRPQQHES